MASADARIDEAWSHRAKGVPMAQNPVPPTFLPDASWDQWLWSEDPNEEAHPDILMNRMQLLGLLIARFRAAYQDVHHASNKCLGDLLLDEPSRKRLCLFQGVPVRSMSLRQLRDSVDNLQVEWFRMRLAETMQPRINDAVDALFHRFGVLASQPWPVAGEVLDDPSSIEPFREGVRMTRICVRRFVNAFFAMYRGMIVWALRQTVADAPNGFDCGIRIHHVVASSDDFSRISMHWDLMLAAKLNYIHDFRGYFNCISQVIYFHDPDYQRRPQDKKRIAEISSGLVPDPDICRRTREENPINAVHMVAPLLQLYPEIEVRHADDAGDLLQRAAQGGWTWLFAGHSLYLVDPGSSPANGIRGVRILHHRHVAPLLHAYLKSKQNKP